MVKVLTCGLTLGYQVWKEMILVLKEGVSINVGRKALDLKLDNNNE